MPNNLSIFRLGDVLEDSRELVEIHPLRPYKQVTVKLHHKGVVLRKVAMGSEIKSKQHLAKSGQLIVSRIDARNGAIGLIPSELDEAVLSNDFLVYNLNLKFILARYLDFLTSANNFVSKCKQASEGTTNRVRLNPDKFLDIEVYLPSITEQEVVVATLEQAKAQVDETRRLREESNAFELLSGRILEKAFEGRLVTQNPEDEPANRRLEHIRIAHREQTKKLVDLSRQPEPAKLPYLPKGWTWAHLRDIATIMDIDHNMPKSVDDGVFFVSAKDFVHPHDIDFRGAKLISQLDFERLSLKFQPEAGDILYSRIGAIGRARKVPSGVKFHISYSLCLIRPHILLKQNDFLYWLLKSPVILSQALAKTRSIGVPDLGLGEINNFIIPVPPLDEQLRIAARIEQIQTKVHQAKSLQADIDRETETLMPSLLDRVFNRSS